MVFHNECNNDNVIDYLPSKDIWVDTIGHVARYIYLRDNSEVKNFIRTDNKIEFNLDLDDRFKNNLYNQNLTLSVNIGNANAVKVNGKNIEYRLIGNKVMFDVPFPIDGRVEVFL